MAYVSDEDILRGELGSIAAVGGAFRGALAAAGGRFGARVAAKLLPTRQYSDVKRLPLDVHEAFRRVRAIVSPLGVWQPEVPKGSTYPALRYLMKKGLFSNPAVLYVEVLETGADEATVVVTALAKEGLIKQDTARKTVQWILSLFEELERAA
jgi:hypothetical protein